MNILITGGLGHIGSFLIRHISGNITVVDNLLTQRYCSLFNLKNSVKFYQQDFSNISDDLIEKQDVVLHLAAITNAENSFKNQDEIEQININLTADFIKRCDGKVKLFVFPSSTSVYGTSSEIMYEDSDLSPQSPYAASKIAIENFIQSNLSSTQYLILRLGTIFGTSPGMRFHTAINKFAYQTAFDIPLTIWKQNYEQYRPYLGLKDALQSLQILLNDSKTWNSVYNVITINEKLKHIVTFIQSFKNIELDMIDTPLINQFSYEVNIDKISKVGYEPKDSLFDGLKETMQIFNGINNG